MADPKIILSSHFGTFHKTGEIYDIIFERYFNHPIHEVWEAITHPNKMSQWLGATTIDLREQGDITILMQGMVINGKIHQLKEQSLLEYTWTSKSFPNDISVVRWELFQETDNTCRLRFTERLVAPVYLTGAGPGWHYILDTLSMALDGKPVPPWSEIAWQQVAEQAREKYKAILAETKDGKSLAAPPVAKASLLIRKPVAEVFEAFIDPAITSQFWYSRGSDRLDAGKPVTWYWDDYGVSTEVSPHAILKNKLIFFTWPGPGGLVTTVDLTFTPKGKEATYVSVEEKGWDAGDKKLVEYVVGQTEGWTFVLSGLKAFLEYGIRLNLVSDHNPDVSATHQEPALNS
ncbi:SRPBCC domain-containing protein [Paraflavitalea speifideaquila]|uniref:SRPBCC domain-containing protein n=1 Tax=Paraflavitalea speifideaquila TaxID=3076558 RepID=UPI0028E8ED8B|nr:SRPBCC domain-containing protein [Paraflavitalea speifideiaquila]